MRKLCGMRRGYWSEIVGTFVRARLTPVGSLESLEGVLGEMWQKSVSVIK